MVGWSGDPGASPELWGSPGPITKFGMGVAWEVRKQGGDARESHRLPRIGREPYPAGREDTPMVTQRRVEVDSAGRREGRVVSGSTDPHPHPLDTSLPGGQPQKPLS